MKRDLHDTNNSHQQHQFPYSGKCGGCGAEERWFLHTVRYRGSYRRLCTNCLLKNHQGVFCPFCFLVYEESLPPNERVMCLKCPSISHLSCVPWSHPNSPPSFLCPSCSSGPSSNFSFFLTPSPSKKPKPNDSSSSSSSSSAVSDGSDKRVIDKDSARALVAAAKIAAASMSKAANVARAEAERRAREAALAKKKAREALERLASCAAFQDNKDKKATGATANGMMMMMRREHMRNGGGPVQGEKGSNGIAVHSASGDLLRCHDYNRGLEK